MSEPEDTVPEDTVPKDTVPKDPAPKETAERFLRHLTGTADEAESQALEQAMLEDDELFQRLTDLESELIDAYVDGELDDETTRRLAPLVGASSRLQAKAETTLALASRQGGLPMTPRSSEPVVSAQENRPRARFFRLAWVGLALALILWLFIQAAGLRASLQAVRAENAELRERSERLEETLSELEASNRTLARRLARLEAEKGR